jgi:hypothetical protein
LREEYKLEPRMTEMLRTTSEYREDALGGKFRILHKKNPNLYVDHAALLRL